jgi:hypothetical protein
VSARNGDAVRSSAIAYPGRAGRRVLPRLGVALGLALVAGLAAWMIASQLLGGPQESSDRATAAFEQTTGIRLLRVDLTGGGGLVDVRYQVLDPPAAAVLHDKATPLKLVDEDSGKALATRFHFHTHTSQFKAGVGYYELLVNTAGMLESGDTVSVVVGTAVLEGVPVL